MHRPLELEVFALLRDLGESAPHVARLLSLVEPTKTIYVWLGRHTDPTHTLARNACRPRASASETCMSGIAQPAGGFSVYSSRVLSGWQVQGGVPHATAPLSD